MITTEEYQAMSLIRPLLRIVAGLVALLFLGVALYAGFYGAWQRSWDIYGHQDFAVAPEVIRSSLFFLAVSIVFGFLAFPMWIVGAVRVFFRIVCGVCSLIWIVAIVALGLKMGWREWVWAPAILSILLGYLAIFGPPKPVRVEASGSR